MIYSPNRLLLIAGPCVVESAELVMDVARHLVQITSGLPIDLVFKSSYRKANRTSHTSFTGIGDAKALEALARVKGAFGIPVLTDIHADHEAAIAAEVCDVLQIPAFLSRQTSLLEAAANTGKVVNIKKGQFMAPEDVIRAADKVLATGNRHVWLTERGTTFGYHDLVVDMRGLITMKASGLPVIYDATHSVQQPSLGTQSGGKSEFISGLAHAAMATGIGGLFIETHPDPPRALSDAATQMPLHLVENFLHSILRVWNAVR
ncbi:MAG: 3-deoxy-8-phosphooctulonate synthase [Chlorobi bacterium]|nr:MAG: 3-deoxy-8-phosphooctulonate synthase [Bacteroidota bacterium]KXK33736.1 MAG: 2-dehydro-3-deoxyphosphooctonate aldolase [Chlorobi bacterium OLB6]MBE2266098.1 3-deoxy-8-phosphooctulonate synthase [Flavobacteriales bacterium]MBL1160670.1 3-deoxy-8-phosphooctulonate synthase [Chlorobiota bacterium]MBW7853021.1 3-deoxy-8-phosphooctulonate synthase [Candidatus Kapabacteria bacterium]MCC6331490.1 3-deoxy-8-phosphooctulonate synthase [Ignavibacteria bacterium]